MTPWLDLYNEWMKTSRISHEGLCNSLPAKLRMMKGWKLILPSDEERFQLKEEGKSQLFWGYEECWMSINFTRDKKYYEFTPLRQTIILLCAALNNEL